MILKKVNNIFVLDDIQEDELNIEMFQTVEKCINILFIDNTGRFYVKNVLILFKNIDEDFSFEIDDSISDNDCIRSSVKFIFCKGDCENDEQRYKIILKIEPNKIKEIRSFMYGDRMSYPINKVKTYKDVKDMIFKKVNNIFVLDCIPEDALNVKLFQTVEDCINNIFIYNEGCCFVKNVLRLFNLFNEDFSFEIDDSISDDDCIHSFVKFIFCKGDCTNGEQRYKMLFQTETKGD